MQDFSKTLFYCTSLGLIMSDGHGKTPAEQLEDAKLLLQEEEAKFDAMKDKSSRSALKKEIKIDDVKKKIADLELRKDEVILSDGCKTYLTQMYAWVKYQKWELPSGGHLPDSIEKGISNEADSISLLNQVNGTTYIKNDKRYESSFICGIPDIIYRTESGEKHIIDIKTSYNIETFFENLGKNLKKQYWWQIQGYLFLTGATKGEIAFCLISPPKEEIDVQVTRLLEYGNQYTSEELHSRFTYDDIPAKDRVLRFVVERDEQAFLKMGKKIMKCREYLSSLEQLHLNGLQTTNCLPANDLLQDVSK